MAMTVKELREILDACDGDMPVVLALEFEGTRVMPLMEHDQGIYLPDEGKRAGRLMDYPNYMDFPEEAKEAGAQMVLCLWPVPENKEGKP